jgi:hypothetical protein
MPLRGGQVGNFFPRLGIFFLQLDKTLRKFSSYSPLEGRIPAMTRTVTEKAMRLLSKSVSDIAGEERRIADALVTALRSSEQVFQAPVQFGLKGLDPMLRHRIHGQAVAVASSLTVH